MAKKSEKIELVTIRKVISRNIKHLRKSKKWTQNDLAVASGVSFRGVQDIESGKRSPRADTLAAIAGSLGVTEKEIYQEKEESTLNAKRHTSAAELSPEEFVYKVLQISTEHGIKRHSREELLAEIRAASKEVFKEELEKMFPPKKIKLLSLIEQLHPDSVSSVIDIIEGILKTASHEIRGKKR